MYNEKIKCIIRFKNNIFSNFISLFISRKNWIEKISSFAFLVFYTLIFNRYLLLLSDILPSLDRLEITRIVLLFFRPQCCGLPLLPGENSILEMEWSNICSGNWKNSGFQFVNRKHIPEFQNTWFWKFPVYGKNRSGTFSIMQMEKNPDNFFT